MWINNRMQREKKTVSAMIRMYCRYNHKKGDLCEDCRELDNYTMFRLDKCPFQDEKPTCINCSVHCFRSSWKDEIKKIMRFSGPKMIWHHPVLAVMHIIDSKIPPKEIKNKTVSQKSQIKSTTIEAK